MKDLIDRQTRHARNIKLLGDHYSKGEILRADAIIGADRLIVEAHQIMDELTKHPDAKSADWTHVHECLASINNSIAALKTFRDLVQQQINQSN